MKHTIFFLLIIFCSCKTKAQTLGKPEDYMSAIANAQVEMNSKYMQYMSTAAHALADKNIESFRQQVVQSIINSERRTRAIPPYRGDNSLQQSSIDYIKLCMKIFNDDFGSIVDMLEIEEQTFNDMQKVLLTQEKAAEKLIESSIALRRSNEAFAKKYNVEIIPQRNKLEEKLAIAARLNNYRNKIFLLFYKCNWQDGELNKAITAKKINDIEQGRNGLIQYAIEGMKGLDVTENFNGDPSLKKATRDALQFYKQMAERDIPFLTDFFLEEEQYNKTKKAFENTDVKRTKAEVAAYNSAAQNYNDAANQYNRINNNIINNRRIVLKNRDETEKRFADVHMPRYREKSSMKKK